MHGPKKASAFLFCLIWELEKGGALPFHKLKMRRTAPGLRVYNIVNLTKI
ncbi:Uncharacterised protein [Bacillus tequilensis]|nr:Uncharacterised protein [Bacillus tequilensis]